MTKKKNTRVLACIARWHMPVFLPTYYLLGFFTYYLKLPYNKIYYILCLRNDTFDFYLRDKYNCFIILFSFNSMTCSYIKYDNNDQLYRSIFVGFFLEYFKYLNLYRFFAWTKNVLVIGFTFSPSVNDFSTKKALLLNFESSRCTG